MYNPPRTLATLLSLASALCLLSPASASLLVYYSFDVEAGDQVANTGTLIGDGTIIGAGTYGPGQDASFGNAFIGNRAGINDARIHTGFFGNQLGMGDNTETYTAMAWILWNGNLDAATEEDHMIFGQDDGEGNNPQLHHGIRGNNDPNLDNIHFGGWGGDQDISDAGTVAPDTWTHVAWQFTGTEKVVYVNGVETARLAGNNITDPTFEVVVGGHGRDAPPGGMVSFNGAIDEVKIYDDVLTAEEIIAASIPNQDRDEDGLTNTEEGNIGTDPDDPDSDDDGMNDGVEVANMLDPLSSEGDDGAEGDPDMDNLGNLAELEEHRTDPQDADTDDDDLNDDRELVAMSDPNLPDTDGDTLLDGIEVDEYMTNPNLRDTDEDGFDDDVEIAQGTDPLDPLDFPGIPEPLIHYTFNTDDGAMVENLGSLGTAGTTSGGVTYGESVDPSFGMAFIGNRNGADDAKVITNHVGTELGMADNTTAYTAMAWLRWDGTAGQVDHMIFGQELADNDEQLHHGIRDDSPANIHFGGWGGTQDISDAGTVVPGEWTHVAWQYNPAGSGDAIVYVNGEQTARQDKNNITTPAQMVIIGGHNRDGVHSFNGAIDEVKIFDAALSAGQIQEVMEPTPFNSAPLQFTDITLDEESDTISLTFNSRAGRTYSLYYRYDLTSELLEENDSIEADPDNPTTTYDFPTPRPVPAGKVFFTLIEN